VREDRRDAAPRASRAGQALEPPRTVWIMVPAGEATQQTVDALAKLLDPDDTIVDGGNSKWTDDKLRAAALRKQKIHYVDVGTSGGVWGLEVGYCMMVGGPNKAVKRLAPILDVLAPADQGRRSQVDRPARLAALRPERCRSLRQDGPQRDRVRPDAGLRRGLRAVPASEFELDNAKIAHLWNQGVGDPLVAVRARRGARSTPTATTSPNSRAGSRTPARVAGRCRTRSTTTCRLPALSAALNSRFYSREDGDYSARVLAALRNQFGGHAVKKSGT
jgi:6-phosphogluconate dehydrogenase